MPDLHRSYQAKQENEKELELLNRYLNRARRAKDEAKVCDVLRLIADSCDAYRKDDEFYLMRDWYLYCGGAPSRLEYHIKDYCVIGVFKLPESWKKPKRHFHTVKRLAICAGVWKKVQAYDKGVPLYDLMDKRIGKYAPSRDYK